MSVEARRMRYDEVLALTELSDVTISSPVDKELLSYDSATGEWINQTFAEIGLDTRYVNVVGDIMTGDLNLNDDVSLAMGDSGIADYYQKFDGTNARYYTTGDYIFEGGGVGDGTGIAIRGKTGTSGDGHGKDITLIGGTAFGTSDADGGNIFIYGGVEDGEGDPGRVILGHDGTSLRGTVEFIENTKLYFGNLSGNSGTIYSDGTDLFIDSANTGDGDLIFVGRIGVRTGVGDDAVVIAGDMNFVQVDNLTEEQKDDFTVTAGAGGTGTLAAGEYHYDTYFICAEGETRPIRPVFGTAAVPSDTVANNGSFTLTNIPISPDDRVTARGIMRTEAGESSIVAQLIHTINDNTTTTYVDTGDAPGTGEINFAKPNTSAGTIMTNGIPFFSSNENNTWAGINTGGSVVGGYNNVGFGPLCLPDLTTANDVTAVGSGAGGSVTIGGASVYIGIAAGLFIETGKNNVMIGASSYPNSAADNINETVSVGKGALINGPGYAQHGNIGVGYQAGKNFGGTWNIHLGWNAGNVSSRIASSNSNINIGQAAGSSFGTGAHRNTMIGWDAQPDDTTGSNQLNIMGIVKGNATSGSEYVEIIKTLEVNAKSKLTDIGGFAIKLTNKTGSNTVAGQLVNVYTATAIDDAFKTISASDENIVGIVLGAGVADGSAAWVVVNGIADVLMDSGGSARGDRIISSATAGSADVWNTGGAVATHFQEVGHCIETKIGAGLARCVLHFN